MECIIDYDLQLHFRGRKLCFRTLYWLNIDIDPYIGNSICTISPSEREHVWTYLSELFRKCSRPPSDQQLSSCLNLANTICEVKNPKIFIVLFTKEVELLFGHYNGEIFKFLFKWQINFSSNNL